MLLQSNTSKIVFKRQENKKTDLRVNSNLNIEKFDVCVIGSGLSGAVIAERYASTTEKSILVLEKRDHIGGNCYDYVDNETGIRVSKYGAHLFHTKYKHVWDYVQHFGEWISYKHKVQALINGKYVPVPVNIQTVNSLFNLHIKTVDEMNVWLQNEQVKYDHDPINSEEMALSRVGKRLYELIFKPYTIKQWNKTPAELGPSVLARIPVRNNWDDRYFSDRYQALPISGYISIFNKMLQHPNITIRLNTDYFHYRKNIECGKTYFTGPIDRFYAEKGLPLLEYRSLQFKRQVIKNVHHFQPASVVNHPNFNENFTRIVEYKWFPYQQCHSNDTVLFIERSADVGEPYYPVPNIQNQNLYKIYKVLTESESDIYFLGRLANYKYFNMDEAINNALEFFYQTMKK
ncbi:UDP-galactopyranose mutase-like [Mercenaria mercenaria]|uniref:UDP-galactopyranose mutase-like n=1 Tax=Mercenaria mercenaria TaxID=6596 RepID=UPI00234EBEC7|nr:UDP-galactopyranose mutase-like [Mercenaria mercenaria]